MRKKSYSVPKELATLFQKRILGKDFTNAKTIHKDDCDNQFQLFEVMIGETINAIFDDYIWHTSSIQGDGGIDFYGEKDSRELPLKWKTPPLIIYGQVKYRSGRIRNDEIEKATRDIINYHREFTLQHKCLYEIIQVIKSSKLIDISYGETVQISNLDTRHYILNIINADDFFQIWLLNKTFLKNLLPQSLSSDEYNKILNYFNSIEFCWGDLFETNTHFEIEQSIGRDFLCRITLKNNIYIPTELVIKIIPHENNKICIVQPAHLLSSNGYKIKVFNIYNLDIQFLPISLGNANLGVLQIYDTDLNLLYEQRLGEVEVTNKFSPTYFSIPNNEINNTLKKELLSNNDNMKLYSFIGEGGIGKSTLINDVAIFALNHGFRSIKHEHACKIYDDNMFLVELFLLIINANNILFNDTEEMLKQVKCFFGTYYCDYWEDQLRMFLNTGYYSNINILMDCWVSALLLTTDRQPLLIHLSNMHWCSPNLMIFFNALVKILTNRRSYFNKKIVFVFEGRTSEINQNDFKKHIPYEWINFTKNEYTKIMRLKKWSDDESRIYAASLFDYNDLSHFQIMNVEGVIDKIIMHSKGNPMHINETIKHLIETNCLALNNNGAIRLLNFETQNIVSESLLDIIQLRITYYILKYSDVMDYIILYINAEECDSEKLSTIILDKLHEKYDVNNLLKDMEFVFVEDLILKVSHEHYRNVLKIQKITNQDNPLALISSAETKGIELSKISINRFLLMGKNPDFRTIAMNIMELLEHEADVHKRYALLQLLCKIPIEILQLLKITKHSLLLNIHRTCRDFGDWNTSMTYINHIKSMQDDSFEFLLTKAQAQLSLSNIYGLKLDLYKGIYEAQDAIKMLESFAQKNISLSEKELFNFRRTLSMLYNRLAIELYMSGQREQAEIVDSKALKIALINNDMYVQNHIKYERGVRLLHTDVEKGKKIILKAKKDIIIPNSKLHRQENDLIQADYLMAQLLSTKETDKKGIRFILAESFTLCNELNTIQEPFESTLIHTVFAIACVLNNDYDKALKYFYIAETAAERASLDSFIWKSYLNIAQIYLLLSETSHYDIYNNDAIFYAKEAKQIIEKGISKNPQIKNCIENVFKHPLNIANAIINNGVINSTEFHKDSCALHVDIQKFSFFLLD